jgi:hypothetical protein
MAAQVATEEIQSEETPLEFLEKRYPPSSWIKDLKVDSEGIRVEIRGSDTVFGEKMERSVADMVAGMPGNN